MTFRLTYSRYEIICIEELAKAWGMQNANETLLLSKLGGHAKQIENNLHIARSDFVVEAMVEIANES